jgi:RNA polymerase sigma-70 factor (ECF subfamily)
MARSSLTKLIRPEQASAYAALYREHFDFVWRSLRRLGVQERELSDATQEVFVVVFRRLSELRLDSKVTTWLYAIALRVASDARRRAHHRYEVFEEAESRREDVGAVDDMRELLLRALSSMPIEQRAVFIAFELEGMSGEEIAEAVGVGVPTVHSRLRLARERFRASVARERAGRANPGGER